MAPDLNQAQRLFQAALQRPASERAAFLDQACAGNAELRRQVETLLRAQTGSVAPASTASMTPPAFDYSTAAFDPVLESHSASEARPEHHSFLKPSTHSNHLGRLGHYEVLAILGKGGFGTVFRAFDEKLHRQVAIKVLAPMVAASDVARSRFVREARAAAMVRNDHLVAIYSVEDEHEPPYLVMELIEGVSLQDRLLQGEPLSVEEIVRIGMQTAEGLAAAHQQGLIHRDIKPGNILLEGSTRRVKITDFGLARAVDDSSVTQSGVIAGTPMFMAPEQALGAKLDPRADLFSLGSVLYVLCTRRPPFAAGPTMAVLRRVIDETPTPIRQINPEIPDWLGAIVEKLHAKRPQDRFGSAREVAQILRRHVEQMRASRVSGGRTSPPANAGGSLTKSRGSRTPLLVATSVAAVLALVLAIVFWPRSTDSTPLKKDDPGDKKTPPIVNKDDGWIALFNGKDLTGWNPGKEASGVWKVDNHHLVGRGHQAWLMTDRTNFKDFHLRMEAKYVGGTAQIVLRGQGERSSAGYWVNMNNERGNMHTGAISTSVDFKAHTTIVREERTKPDTWFTLEVIARGKHFQTFVNGEKALDWTDPAPKNVTEGSLRLYLLGKDAQLHVKKIEIKDLSPTELPPTDVPPTKLPPTGAPSPAIAPFNAVKAKEQQNAWAAHLGKPVEFENSVGMKFCLIPPGEYTRGLPQEEPGSKMFGKDQPEHTVVIRSPFYIGAMEVTRKQYEAVMGPIKNPFDKGGPNHPATWVTWHDAVKFCNLLSERDEEKKAGRVYRLAAEAEWEYACRAGSETPYFFGPIDNIGEYAWFADNSGGRTNEVGLKKANAWGLYDMIGNVHEWCADSYRSYPEILKEAKSPGRVEHDPQKPLPFGISLSKTLRSSNYRTSAVFATSTSRAMSDPMHRVDTCGFRVVVVGNLREKE